MRRDLAPYGIQKYPFSEFCSKSSLTPTRCRFSALFSYYIHKQYIASQQPAIMHRALSLNASEERQGLLVNSEQDANEITNASKNVPSFEHPRSSRYLKWCSPLTDSALPLIILCSIIDLVLVCALYLIHPSNQFPSQSSGSIDDIPLRSTYLNFDKLYRNSTFPHGRIKPIVNHASAFYQVSSKIGERDKVIDVWSDLRFTTVGMVPQFGQHLIVNSTVGTP